MLWPLLPVSHPHNEPPKWSSENIHFPCHGCALTGSSGPETHPSLFTHELINSKREVPMSYWINMVKYGDWSYPRVTALTDSLVWPLPSGTHYTGLQVCYQNEDLRSLLLIICFAERIKSKSAKGWLMKTQSAFFSSHLGMLAKIGPAFHISHQHHQSGTGPARPRQAKICWFMLVHVSTTSGILLSWHTQKKRVKRNWAQNSKKCQMCQNQWKPSVDCSRARLSARHVSLVPMEWQWSCSHCWAHCCQQQHAPARGPAQGVTACCHSGHSWLWWQLSEQLAWGSCSGIGPTGCAMGQAFRGTAASGASGVLIKSWPSTTGEVLLLCRALWRHWVSQYVCRSWVPSCPLIDLCR